VTFVPKSKLPRLPREFYQGRAIVLWTHTFEDRAQGWLNNTFHAQFREVLLHACHRYELASPCYVLMPDHWHLVWMGLCETSDQWLATAFLRKHLQPPLAKARLQDRAHDRVLRDEERTVENFQTTCTYVFLNPQRANLRGDWREWPYVGAIVPGYPDLDPGTTDFWGKYWKIFNRLVDYSDPAGVPALTRRATTPSVARCVSSGTESPLALRPP
jgi:putative transposase